MLVKLTVKFAGPGGNVESESLGKNAWLTLFHQFLAAQSTAAALSVVTLFSTVPEDLASALLRWRKACKSATIK